MKSISNWYTRLSLASVTLAVIFSFTQAQSVKYGGSSYAHIKNKQGETKVVHAFTTCSWDTEADAKKHLEPHRIYGEEFDSQIYYSIDTYTPGDKKRYGGSSSARVKNKQGVTRVVTSTTNCTWQTKADAKNGLIPSKIYGEEFITAITFDIDACQ